MSNVSTLEGIVGRALFDELVGGTDEAGDDVTLMVGAEGHDLAKVAINAIQADGYSIVKLPEPYPDDTVHPYWVTEDTNGPQLVRVTDSDEGVEGNWVGIEFSARHRTITRETARELGIALLAAADKAETKR